MIKYVQGDLLQSQEAYIAQGVAEGNQEGLGTGLALTISRRWPKVQAAFKKHARSGLFKGGTIWVHQGESGGLGLVYMATQPDMRHAKVSYLRMSLRQLRKWAEAKGVASIGLPKVGAGLGKLSWKNEVKPLFEEVLADSSVLFVIYETFRTEHEHNV
jgi:O-acetyl-ADP-ribose deacetylase (regulator of RNase III)